MLRTKYTINCFSLGYTRECNREVWLLYGLVTTACARFANRVQERVFSLTLKIKLRKETKWQVYFRVSLDVGKQDPCFTKFDIRVLIRRSLNHDFPPILILISCNGNFFLLNRKFSGKNCCLNNTRFILLRNTPCINIHYMESWTVR